MFRSNGLYGETRHFPKEEIAILLPESLTSVRQDSKLQHFSSLRVQSGQSAGSDR